VHAHDLGRDRARLHLARAAEADRVVVMRAGRVAAAGTYAELREAAHAPAAVAEAHVAHAR